jgi:hypothetical protein
MEHRFLDSNTPFPFTPSWYGGREAAHHLEEELHRDRIIRTSVIVKHFVATLGVESVVDLGCGDGGLLSLIQPFVLSWGYDLQPDNIRHAQTVRHVDARLGDFMNDPAIEWGNLGVITECLEHLEDPHSAVRTIGQHCRFIVASTPPGETPDNHYELHAWGWDKDGISTLLEQGGFQVLSYFANNDYQIVTGEHV